MALHQAPTDGRRHEGFHFHIEFHPPLRKPNLLKYLAGPEIGGGSFLSDTSPEEKAAELRAVSPVHYKSQTGEARTMSESKRRPDRGVSSGCRRRAVRPGSGVRNAVSSMAALVRARRADRGGPGPGPARRDGGDRRLLRLARPPVADPRGHPGGRPGGRRAGPEDRQPGGRGRSRSAQSRPRRARPRRICSKATTTQARRWFARDPAHHWAAYVVGRPGRARARARASSSIAGCGSWSTRACPRARG